VREGGTSDPDEGVDGDALGVGVEAGEFDQHSDAVVDGLTHADDAAAADGDAGLADVAEGEEAILVGAGGDDGFVVIAAGVEVVVVGVEAGLLEATGLILGEHAEGAAGLEAELLDALDHVDDALEGGAIFDLAPGGAHAEAGGAGLAGAPCGGEDLIDLEQALGADGGIVVGRLGAIGAIFGASAGLDAQQGAELHLAVGVVGAMDGAGPVYQLEEG
jgi:hypothetical protein